MRKETDSKRGEEIYNDDDYDDVLTSITRKTKLGVSWKKRKGSNLHFYLQIRHHLPDTYSGAKKRRAGIRYKFKPGTVLA